MKRRKFLSQAGALLSYPGLASFSHLYPEKQLNVALIGCGWYGKSDLLKLLQLEEVNVVGLSDPDDHHTKEAQTWVSNRVGQKPKIYRDHRDLLSRHSSDLVIIGSPDHWHALHAIDAMEAGANLYLQKPVSLDVLEGEAILATARRLNKTVQVGTQRRSTPHLREAKQKIIDSGLIGKVTHVQMCCYYPMRAQLSHEIQKVPDHLDYDLWIGPAKALPYTGRPHRGYWRAKTEYSNGILGDMCVHMYDTARWMLGLGWPEEIYSSGGIYKDKISAATTTDTQMAVFKHPELECVWHHRTYGPAPDPNYPWSVMFYGENGVLKADVWKYDYIPRSGDPISGKATYEKEEYPEDLEERDNELHAAPATRRHLKDLLDAIHNKSLPISDIEEGHISSAACILANLSMKLGRSLRYDPHAKTISGDPKATDQLHRTYRKGWKHPYFA